MKKHDSDNSLTINAEGGINTQTSGRIPSVPAEVLKLSGSHYPMVCVIRSGSDVDLTVNGSYTSH